LEESVRELGETVQDLQKRMNQSAPKKKKADEPSNESVEIIERLWE
jgi:hypothetical protein